MSHFSELGIDKLLAGELDRDAASALRTHAAECERCSETLANATTTRDSFTFRPVPRTVRWRSAAIAAPLALAAALALLFAWPAEPAGDRIRMKGAASVGLFGVFVAHGTSVRRGTVHETVMPGDRLEFATSTTTPGWFAALSVDANGMRSVYVPLEAIAAGHEQLTTGAIELDDALGRETVTGVFCDHVFDPRSLDLAALPEGCSGDRLTLDKVAR